MRKYILSSLLVLSALTMGACSNSKDKKNDVVDAPQTPQSPETPNPPVSPEPTYHYFGYVGAQYANLIYGYALDAKSGAATELPTPSVASAALPMITTASFDQKFLLAANYSANSVSSYSINPSSGELTLIEHQALAASAAPAWVVGHPLKNIFYVAESGLAKIAVLDMAGNGDLTERATVNSGAGVTALVINDKGTLLYSVDQSVDQIGVYAIDGNGDLTFLNAVALPTGSQPNAATLSKNGKFLYTADWGTASISGFAISGTTLTSLGAPVSAGTGGVYTVTVSPDGSRIYAAKPYGNSYSEHTLDAATGAIGAAVETALPGSVSFSFFGDFVFALSWTGNIAGLPIQTRTYSSTSGMGTTPLFSTATSNRGQYQMTIVRIKD